MCMRKLERKSEGGQNRKNKEERGVKSGWDRTRVWGAMEFYLYQKGNENQLMGIFKDHNRWRWNQGTRDGILATF